MQHTDVGKNDSESYLEGIRAIQAARLIHQIPGHDGGILCISALHLLQ